MLQSVVTCKKANIDKGYRTFAMVDGVLHDQDTIPSVSCQIVEKNVAVNGPFETAYVNASLQPHAGLHGEDLSPLVRRYLDHSIEAGPSEPEIPQHFENSTHEESDSGEDVENEEDDSDEEYFYSTFEELEQNGSPNVGMRFTSLEKSKRFYNTYGLLKGFAIKVGQNYKR